MRDNGKRAPVGQNTRKKLRPDNVDPLEVAKFNQLASRWWDRNGSFRTLHTLNPLRIDYMARRSGDLSGKRVLDVGCGGGILSEGLAHRGAEVTGIDVAESPLQVARLHQLETGVTVDYRHIAPEQLAEQSSGTYDVLACMELLEHVPDPMRTVSACSTLLKPGGHGFFSTINRHPKAFLFAILGAEYLLRLLPKGTHDYTKFIRPSELDQWVRAAGLHLMELQGIAYNPLTGGFRLTDDVSVNYIAWVRKGDAPNSEAASG